MNKRITALAILLLAAALLGGCQFAMEEAEGLAQDTLCGVAVYVNNPGEPDEIDEEGNLYWYPDEDDAAEENVWENMDGDDAYIGQTGEEIELTEEEFKALLGGRSTGISAWSDEMELGKYYWYLYTEEKEYGLTTGSEQNWPGEIDKTHIIVNDDGEGFELEGTVYLCGDLPEYASLHFAPIYMRPDGSVYARREAAGVSGMIDGFSQTFTTETTVKNIDGGTEKRWSEIRVNVKQVKKTVSASILAFDAQHTLLSETTLVPEQEEYGWRCEYQIPDGAAYLLLEETKENGEIQRACADISEDTDPNDSIFKYFIPNGDGFAVPCQVWLPME